MSYYARLRLLVEADDYETFPAPNQHHIEVDLTPDEGMISASFDAGPNGAAYAHNLSMFTTIQAFIVHNMAAEAADVTLVYDDTTGGTCTLVLTGGGLPLVTPDLDPAVAPTFESADATTPRIKITVFGT